MDKKNPAPYLLILSLGLAISVFAIKGHFTPQVLGLLVFCLIFIPTLIKPDIGLIILIVSMLFSPDFVAGETSRRVISIRTEDILLLVVILAWFLRTSLSKNIAEVFRTKMTKSYLSYIAICIFSTVFAALSINIDFKYSFFSILKYFEYFVLFIMVKDNLKNMRQAKVFVVVFFLTALLVAITCSLSLHREIVSGEHSFRLGPPVDTRGGGESGTIGGYLLFMMAIAGGFLIYEKSMPTRIFLIVLEFFMFRALLYTLSRGSYVACLFMAMAFIYFVKKNRLVIFCVMIAVILLTGVLMPNMVRERIASTAMMKEDITGGRHLEWEESPQARMTSWKSVMFDRFPGSPLLGYGVGKFFIDSQLFLTLNEVGLLGLIIFIWVLITLYRAVRDIHNTDVVENDTFSISLTTGFLVGFIGLLVHSVSTNTFIIISIMEPFWFMAAIVLSLPSLLEADNI